MLFCLKVHWDDQEETQNFLIILLMAFFFSGGDYLLDAGELYHSSFPDGNF
ncbi:hypothetical protein [Chryseobacterium gossypii]|uniref:hypothetical protein n=1 Tax=Chryseobacterium gossypii TaxID=3231602 RepID=UPI003525247C